MVLVAAVVGIDVLEDLDLVQTLVKKVLVVLDDLDTNVGAISKVDTLNRLGKRCCAKEFKDLVAPSNNTVDVDWVVLGFFEARTVPLVHNLQVKAIVVDGIVINI